MTTVKEQRNAAGKDQVLNEKPSNIDEVELSNGVIAKCIRPKGKHVVEAQRLMDADPSKMMAALISVCTSVNDKKLTIEGVLNDMDAGDFFKLMAHFGPVFQ